uniref:Uncharacterized protein n=1 Tax=Ditylenchus dipsaci TaxID=166011 RepID=A0A915E9U0_9BILA
MESIEMQQQQGNHRMQNMESHIDRKFRSVHLRLHEVEKKHELLTKMVDKNSNQPKISETKSPIPSDPKFKQKNFSKPTAEKEMTPYELAMLLKQCHEALREEDEYERKQ